MPLNPGIILAGQQQQRPNYLGELAAVSQIKAQQEDTKRRNLLKDAAAGAVGPDGSVDYNALRGSLFKAGDVEGGMKIDSHLASRDKAAIEAENAKLDRAVKVLDVSTRLLGGVQDQASYDAAIAQGRQLGLPGMDQVPPQYDPAFVDGLLQKGLSAKERIAQALQERQFGETQRHNLATEANAAMPTYSVQPTADGSLVGINTRNPSQVVPTGQMAPPKSGQRFSVTTPEGTTVEYGSGEGLSTKARGQVETDMLSAGKQLAQTTAILARFRPEYQEILTRGGMAWNSVKDKFDSNALSPEERQALTEFTQARAEGAQYFNDLMKELAGTAVTAAEADRQKVNLPNTGSGIFDGDSPTEFYAKARRMQEFQRRALMRLAYISKNGMSIEDVPLDRMPKLLNMRGDELAADYKSKGVPDDQIEGLVRQSLADEFGLVN